MKILVVTNMYPSSENPVSGIFVKEQVQTLQALCPEWQFDVIYINGQKSRWNYLQGFLEIHRYIQNSFYDIIHAHYGLTGALARFQLVCPLVVTFHGSDIYIPWQRWISKIVSKLADRVIVVSEKLKEKLACPTAEVIPCGVDLKLFQSYDQKEARDRLNLPLDQKIVIFPGDPQNPVKDYKLFNTAINFLPRELLKEIKVIPLINISRELMPWILSAADVLVITSKYEGSSMVTAEALACNLPIVAVDVGNISKFLFGVSNCYICSRDPKELAQRITAVIEQGGRSNGRKRILELQLDSNSIAKRVLDVYYKVINDQK